MKFFLMFMFVAVALADQESEVNQDELARKLSKIFRINKTDSLECIRKSGVKEEDMHYMGDTVGLDDAVRTNMTILRKVSSTLVCCGEKMGIMQGETENLLKYFREGGMPDDILTRLRNYMYTYL